MRTLVSKINYYVMTLVIGTFLTSCGDSQEEPPREPSVRPIKLLTIEHASNRRMNRYPAVIDASALSELSFQVGGLLEELNYKEAEQVEQGAVIAMLDQRDFVNKVSQIRASFENADEEYKRAVRLTEENAIAKSVLEERKSQRNIAKAQLDTAEKALSDTVLVAPFSGNIATLPVKILQRVQAGQLIATVIDTSEMEATINLPASIIADFQNRTDSATVVMLSVAPDNRIKAEFKKATMLAESTSQTFSVTFSFPPPSNLIVLPGMNATVEISSSSAETVQNHASVPLAAVMSDGSVQYVWIVDSELMTVSKRSVSIKPGIGETVVITGGLSPGDIIAGAGAAYLSEGLQVRPWIN